MLHTCFPIQILIISTLRDDQRSHSLISHIAWGTCDEIGVKATTITVCDVFSPQWTQSAKPEMICAKLERRQRRTQISSKQLHQRSSFTH